MPRENEAEFIAIVLKGYRPAIDFCNTVFRVSQVIDDLIDRDKPVDNQTIMNAFWDCLVTLPNNPFYRENFGHLNPLLQTFFNDWMDSCVLEKGDDHQKNIAFVLRDSIGTILIQCAYIIGGYHWMREVSVKIREHIFEDTLEQFKGGAI